LDVGLCAELALGLCWDLGVDRGRAGLESHRRIASAINISTLRASLDRSCSLATFHLSLGQFERAFRGSKLELDLRELLDPQRKPLDPRAQECALAIGSQDHDVSTRVGDVAYEQALLALLDSHADHHRALHDVIDSSDGLHQRIGIEPRVHVNRQAIGL
jgi:hypothetical protein